METRNSSERIDATAQPCSTSAVYRRLHGRSLPADFRVIADLRKLNLGFEVDQFYHAVTHMVVQIAQRIMKLKSAYPPSPVMIWKRDADATFHKAPTLPDLRKLLRREMAVGDLHLSVCAYSRIIFSVS